MADEDVQILVRRNELQFRDKVRKASLRWFGRIQERDSSRHIEQRYGIWSYQGGGDLMDEMIQG